jgi:hypothetical protein
MLRTHGGDSARSARHGSRGRRIDGREGLSIVFCFVAVYLLEDRQRSLFRLRSVYWNFAWSTRHHPPPGGFIFRKRSHYFLLPIDRATNGTVLTVGSDFFFKHAHLGSGRQPIRGREDFNFHVAKLAIRF